MSSKRSYSFMELPDGVDIDFFYYMQIVKNFDCSDDELGCVATALPKHIGTFQDFEFFACREVMGFPELVDDDLD